MRFDRLILFVVRFHRFTQIGIFVPENRRLESLANLEERFIRFFPVLSFLRLQHFVDPLLRHIAQQHIERFQIRRDASLDLGQRRKTSNERIDALSGGSDSKLQIDGRGFAPNREFVGRSSYPEQRQMGLAHLRECLSRLGGRGRLFEIVEQLQRRVQILARRGAPRVEFGLTPDGKQIRRRFVGRPRFAGNRECCREDEQHDGERRPKKFQHQPTFHFSDPVNEPDTSRVSAVSVFTSLLPARAAVNWPLAAV